MNHDGASGRPHAIASGLYLITPEEEDDARLLARVEPVLPHATCLQYRNKRGSVARRRRQADALRDACARRGVPFIVNDDAALAADVGADGVHLGEHDGAIAAARALLGNKAIIGVSCYDDLTLARTAVAQGADYLAVGAFFPSPTKPLARRASLELARAARPLGLPLVAIGGITPDNVQGLLAAGIDVIAVISGVFEASDPVAAARACSACFS